MTYSTSLNQEIQQLTSLIEDLDCGMLTTVDDDGSLHSRPMSICGEIDTDGTMWFFTFANSHKVAEIEQRHEVNLSFTALDEGRYISISGTAELVRERNKIQEKWQPDLQVWFPQGLNEPDMALLKVKINRVDYWDSPSKFQAQTINFRELSPL